MGKYKCDKVGKIINLQNHTMRLMSNKDIFSHSRDLFRLDKILKVYQLTKLNFTTFMHKIQNQTIPKLLLAQFHKPQHKHSTNFAKLNYQIPPINQGKANFACQ